MPRCIAPPELTASLVRHTIQPGLITCMSRVLSACAAVVLLAAAVPIQAQAPPDRDTGSVSGFILDPLDGGVPDIRLFLTETTTQVQHIGKTNTAGYFEFEELPVGTYWMTPDVEFVATSTITVTAKDRVEHTIKMQLGHLDIHLGICAECVIVIGNRDTPPVPPQASEHDDRIRNQSVVGPRMATPERLFTLPYPEPLRERRVTGRVSLEGRIGTDGFATAMQVISTDHPDLGPAAIEALKELQWEPARMRGVLVEYPLTVTIDFRTGRGR
jgi:TonB family protein